MPVGNVLPVWARVFIAVLGIPYLAIVWLADPVTSTRIIREKIEDGRYQRALREHAKRYAPTLYLKDAVPPLPAQRRRRLSLSETETSGNSWFFLGRRRTSMQEQSPFFRLPADLRLAIYRLAFPQGKVHILTQSNRLAAIPCDDWQFEGVVERCFGSQSCSCINNRTTPVKRHHMMGPHSHRLDPLGMFTVRSVLRVCRRMYNDAIYVLYAWRTFHFYQLDAVLALSTSILPQRFHAITRLQFEGVNLSDLESHMYHFPYLLTFRERHSGEITDPPMAGTPRKLPTAWAAACEVIASMERLNVLRVRMTSRVTAVHPRRETDVPADEEVVFGPLRRIRRPRNFTVEVNWAETETFQKGDAPFTVIRDPERQVYKWRTRVW